MIKAIPPKSKNEQRKNKGLEYYKKSLRIYFKFLRFLKPYWKVGVITGLLMIFSALLQIPAPLLTKYLIDTIVTSGDLVKLNIFALILVGVVIVKDVVNYYESYLLINYRNKVEEDIRSSLFEKILKTRIPLLEKVKAGYTGSRISSDVDAAGNLFLETLLSLIIDLLTFLVGAALCFYLNVELAVISLLSLPVFIISFHIFSKKMNLLSNNRQEKWAVLQGSTIEYISQSKTIKAFNKAKDIYTIFKKALKDAILSNKKLELYNVISGIAVGITGVLLPLFVLWYGVREIILGSFTLGGFIAFNTCIAYLYDPVKNFVSLNINIHSALAAAERIFQVLEYKEEEISFGKKRIDKIESIEFKNVSFFYEGEEKRGVEDISFFINKGNKIVIIGETGKGKSTVARLVLGFDIPCSGEISINNCDYRVFSLPSIRDKIGYVPQEPDLFTGTILENIVFFSNKYKKSFLNKVIKWCVLEKTIKRFPEGLNTNVFETGSGLSGGEKQRIAIARAIIKRPDFLMLDEAASAVDPKTERKLITNLLTLPWSPGILMISHRYSHLDKFDEVLNLDKKTLKGPGEKIKYKKKKEQI